MERFSEWTSEVVLYIKPEEIPGSLRHTKLGDMIYIEEPVFALTSRQYLEGTDADYTLSRLFQERGDFFPFNPRFVHDV